MKKHSKGPPSLLSLMLACIATIFAKPAAVRANGAVDEDADSRHMSHLAISFEEQVGWLAKVKAAGGFERKNLDIHILPL